MSLLTQVLELYESPDSVGRIMCRLTQSSMSLLTPEVELYECRHLIDRTVCVF